MPLVGVQEYALGCSPAGLSSDISLLVLGCHQHRLEQFDEAKALGGGKVSHRPGPEPWGCSQVSCSGGQYCGTGSVDKVAWLYNLGLTACQGLTITPSFKGCSSILLESCSWLAAGLG